MGPDARDTAVDADSMIMSNLRPHYWDGQEVHVGDRVNHAGHVGTIVFIIDPNEFSGGFEPSDWLSLGCGFMVKQDDGQMFYYGGDQSNEDTDLLQRRLTT